MGNIHERVDVKGNLINDQDALTVFKSCMALAKYRTKGMNKDGSFEREVRGIHETLEAALKIAGACNLSEHEGYSELLETLKDEDQLKSIYEGI